MAVITCIECRRTMQLILFEKAPVLCSACMCIPGWNSVPELRERIDPLHRAIWHDYLPEPGRARKKARGSK